MTRLSWFRRILFSFICILSLICAVRLAFGLSTYDIEYTLNYFSNFPEIDYEIFATLVNNIQNGASEISNHFGNWVNTYNNNAVGINKVVIGNLLELIAQYVEFLSTLRFLYIILAFIPFLANYIIYACKVVVFILRFVFMA